MISFCYFPGASLPRGAPHGIMETMASEDRIFLIGIAILTDFVQAMLNLAFVGLLLNPIISLLLLGAVSILSDGYVVRRLVLVIALESLPLGILPIWTVAVWRATSLH